MNKYESSVWVLALPSLTPSFERVKLQGTQTCCTWLGNRPSPKTFQCPPVVNVIVALSCPTNAKSHLEPMTRVVRAAASYVSSAQPVDRTDHLAGAYPQERRSTPSHCVAKPLAQLRRSRTWIYAEQRMLLLQLGADFEMYLKRAILVYYRSTPGTSGPVCPFRESFWIRYGRKLATH